MSFSAEPVVLIKNLSVVQQYKTVLANVDCQIAKGEFVYLVGRTGSGKSSLMKTLYADLPIATGGEAWTAGFELHTLPRHRVYKLRRKIGIVFQDLQLFMDRTVAENLVFVMKATGWSDKAKIKQRLSESLMQVGLGSVANKLPHQLSGGEQQRVVIARALINEPAILFADEPTGNLDPDVANSILKLFTDINRSGTAVLMATHNHHFLKEYPARALKCHNGRLLDSLKEDFPLSDGW